MLKELLNIFRSDNPLIEMTEEFSEMLDLAHDLTIRAGSCCFDQPATPEQRTEIYKQDIKVNQLERSIRKRVIAHLALETGTIDVTYCLLLMSLVKDAERIGDYAKNICEIREIHPDPLPDGDLLAEIKEIRAVVESTFAEVNGVIATSDRDEALELVRQGRDLTRRAENLIVRIAASDHGARATTALVLCARYYKRVAGHLLNLLSSVVMPLHKLDYYDEKHLVQDSEDHDREPL